MLSSAALLLALALASGWSGPAPAQLADEARSGGVDGTIQTWRTLTAFPGTAGFDALSGFLVAHPGWPGETALVRAAERQAAGASPSAVTAYFRVRPPRTGPGHAAYALALAASGKRHEGEQEVRVAWVSPGLDAAAEAALQAAYPGLFTAAAHAARADRLLWAHDLAGVRRVRPYLSAADAAPVDARLALQSGQAGAESLALLLVPADARQPGVVFDRASWLARQGREPEGRRLLAASVPDPGSVGDPVAWLKLRVDWARSALRDGDAGLAYALVDRAQAFPLGRYLNERPLTERGPYTDAEWLAGWIALRRLNRPGDAARHFDAYRAAVLTPVSGARGDYWEGRAVEARDGTEAARRWYARAAEHPDVFYGQLAAARLGQAPALPRVDKPEPTREDRRRWRNDDRVQALPLLDRANQTAMLRAIGDTLDTPGLVVLAADYGRTLGRPDFGVIAGRAARGETGLAIVREAFPLLPYDGALGADWAIAHGIGRQETNFDRAAISYAGARGLLQLMPATAAATARRAGLPYDPGRLLSDPAYNAALGVAYYRQVRDIFDGNPVMAVAAYNAGPGNVRKFIARNGDPRSAGVDIVDWIELIPIEQTRDYVRAVIGNAVTYANLDPARAPGEGRIGYWLGPSAR